MHDIRPYLPELFTTPGTLLYIGARVDAHSWLDELLEVGHQVTILEAWSDNAKGIWGVYNLTVITADVRYLVRTTEEALSSHPNHFTLPSFDTIFWWHGPEHLLQSEIADVVATLESKANKLVAMACPYGVYPQGAHAGNPYEVHLATIYPNFFEWLGYETATDGEADKAGSEIVAWKRLK